MINQKYKKNDMTWIYFANVTSKLTNKQTVRLLCPLIIITNQWMYRKLVNMSKRNIYPVTYFKKILREGSKIILCISNVFIDNIFIKTSTYIIQNIYTYNCLSFWCGLNPPVSSTCKSTTDRLHKYSIIYYIEPYNL